MPDFLDFIEGNVIHIPKMKDEKDGIHLSEDWPRVYYFFSLNLGGKIMNMDAIAIFFICDEVVKFFNLKDDPQYKMTNAEVMTFALLSALYYHANYRTARLVCMSLAYFPEILSHSRLVRRIHSIPESVWWFVFTSLQMYLRKSPSEYFIVDSFPVKAYESQKSFRAKIFRGKEYHGYTASKK